MTHDLTISHCWTTWFVSNDCYNKQCFIKYHINIYTRLISPFGKLMQSEGFKTQCIDTEKI